MEFVVYVLRDEKGKFYKGMTNNLERRILEHGAGYTKSTRHMENIAIVYAEKYDKLGLARKREKYFKSAAGRRFLKKQLNMVPIA